MSYIILIFQDAPSRLIFTSSHVYRIFSFALYTVQYACCQWINPRTAKLFQLTFAAKGGGLLQPPWILVFPTEFLREIFHGYSFGVKESKGDS